MSRLNAKTRPKLFIKTNYVFFISMPNIIFNMFQILVIFYLIYILWVKGEIPFVGFDCDERNSNGQLNFTTWSILEPRPCNLDFPKVESKNISIQLLQVLHFQDIEVFQCKIKIRRTFRRCSLFGYLEPVENGLQEYLLHVGFETCKRIHDTGNFVYDCFHVL